MHALVPYILLIMSHVNICSGLHAFSHPCSWSQSSRGLINAENNTSQGSRSGILKESGGTGSRHPGASRLQLCLWHVVFVRNDDPTAYHRYRKAGQQYLPGYGSVTWINTVFDMAPVYPQLRFHSRLNVCERTPSCSLSNPSSLIVFQGILVA